MNKMETIIKHNIDGNLIHFYESCWKSELRLGYQNDLFNQELFLNLYNDWNKLKLAYKVLFRELCETCVIDYELKTGSKNHLNLKTFYGGQIESSS